MKPVIAVTMGDFNGIGPEILLKSLSVVDREKSQPVVVGDEIILNYYLDRFGLNTSVRTISSVDQIKSDSTELNVIPVNSSPNLVPDPGSPTKASGKASMKAVKIAVNLCLQNHCAAMVTAPISKHAIQAAGYPYPGHTEYLAELTQTDRYQMMLISGSLRVALATVHIPLKEVPPLVTRQNIRQNLEILTKTLQESFQIKTPRIAVLGLNPHSGDGGVLGMEEIEQIQPAIESATDLGAKVEGPFAADGFFGSSSWKHFDAVLATYHDQGLIPFKTLSFGKGVNFTAGLPIIRTSPDHGTAYDLAGKNRASADSMLSAYSLAAELAGL